MSASEISGRLSSAKIVVLRSACDAEIGQRLVRLLLDVYSLRADQILTLSTSELTACVGQSAERLASDITVLVLISVEGLKCETTTLDTWERLASLVGTPPIAILLDDIRLGELPATLKQHAPVHLRDAFELEEALGTIAGTLGTGNVLSLAAMRPQIAQLTQYRSESSLAVGRRRRNLRFTVGLLGALTLALGAYIVHARLERATEAASRSMKFDFERGSHVWHVSTSPGSRACATATLSDSESHYGHQSLQIAVELDAADESKRQGEVYIDLATQASTRAAHSEDLSNALITAWVKASAKIAGDEAKPNGVQLFVRDAAGRSQYGPWLNLRPRQWQQVHIAVGRAANGEFVNAGFDPSNVTVVGLKVATSAAASGRYSGPLYLDSVDWGNR